MNKKEKLGLSKEEIELIIESLENNANFSAKRSSQLKDDDAGKLIERGREIGLRESIRYLKAHLKRRIKEFG